MQNHEHIHPAQYNEQLRMRNDIETLFGECLRGPMRTPLELTYDYLDPEADLRAEDGGKLGPVFDQAIQDIEQKAAIDNRYNFDVRRRKIERKEYEDMITMMEDEDCNTIVVRSDFPEEVRQMGHSFAGYDIERQQAYLRVLVRHGNSIFMYSQSLDGSDRDGLEAIGNYLGHTSSAGELLPQRIKLTMDESEQHMLIDALTSVYDQTLQQKTGIKHYAGMQIQATQHIDTLVFTKQQTDIVSYALSLQNNGLFSSEKRYDLIALLNERYEMATSQGVSQLTSVVNSVGYTIMHQEYLEQQSQDAGVRAQAQGKTWNACGMTMEILQQPNVSAKLEAAGYSSGREDDKFGPRRFKCTQGHWNKRPYNEMITKCWVASCKEGSVGCGKPTKKAKK